MTGETQADLRITAIAEAGLDWLAGDVEELTRFMSECGYSPASLRGAIGTRPLEVAIVEYFARNESQLLAMTANSGMQVNEVMHAYWRLNPGGA